VAGATGPAGDSTEWLTDAGAPANGLGDVGDFYLDSANGDYYLKTGVATWTSQGSFQNFIDISSLNALTGTTLDSLDELFIQDVSVPEKKKITVEEFSRRRLTSRIVTVQEDFLATVSNILHLDATSSGTGASVQTGTYGIDGTEKAIGVWELDTGTTAAGRAMFHNAVASIMFGICQIYQQWRAAINNLSTLAERFTIRIGFSDTTAAGEAVDGAYFRYRDDVNSGRWECVTRSNSVETVTDSGITVDTQYHDYDIEINDTATSVVFKIDGAIVATILTNIPTGSARLTGSMIKIEKSLGITQRNLYVDYFSMQFIFTGDR
jgi:hypothetical protein